MPAKSQKQRRFFRMIKGIKNGTSKTNDQRLKNIANIMSDKQIDDYIKEDEQIKNMKTLQSLIKEAQNSDYLKGQNVTFEKNHIARYRVYKNINGVFYGEYQGLLYGPFRNVNDLHKFMNTNNRQQNVRFEKINARDGLINLPKQDKNTKSIIRNFDKKLDITKDIKNSSFNMLNMGSEIQKMRKK